MGMVDGGDLQNQTQSPIINHKYLVELVLIQFSFGSLDLDILVE